MKKTLIATGHTCEEAEDGLVAVEKVKMKAATEGMKQYDAVLMDFVMVG